MLDAFSHLTPRPLLRRFRELAPHLPALTAFERLPELWDVDARLASLDPFPGLQQVLNMGNPPVEVLGPPAVAAELARECNETLAALCAAHPDRFPGFTATVPMNDVDLALAEIDHAVGTLGACGLQVYTNVAGAPLSLPVHRPVFARMAELDLPVLIHPFRGPDRSDYATEAASLHEIWFTFGWPYESSACAAMLVHSGLFEELPDVKVVLHHFGGMIPSFGDRAGLGFQQIFTGPGGANPVAASAGLTGDLRDSYRRFYADTDLNGSAAGVRCGHAFFGTSHSLFGTDAPFCQDGGPTFVQGALDAVRSLGLSAEETVRILDGNARELFRLPRAPVDRPAPADVDAR